MIASNKNNYKRHVPSANEATAAAAGQLQEAREAGLLSRTSAQTLLSLSLATPVASTVTQHSR